MARDSRLLTAKSAKELDAKAEKLGISKLLLMENAGRQVAEEVIEAQSGKMPVAIFCGKGNNGGDGLVAARHLLTWGRRVDIFLAGRLSEVKNEAGINLAILLKLKQKIRPARQEDLRSIKRRINSYGLIVDALLGVGLEGEIRGSFRDLIGIINGARAYVLSVDIPSGLDATTGRVLGCCIEADKTVTFVAKKRGMVMQDGSKHCGKIIVKDLGVRL